jgi:ribonuclease E
MTSAVAHLSLDAALDGLPAKVRVHDLAKRAGIGSKEMISALAGAGVSVGSASSSVDRDTAAAILTSLLASGDADLAVSDPSAADPSAADPSAADEGSPTAGGEVVEPVDDGRPRRRRGRGGRGRSRAGSAGSDGSSGADHSADADGAADQPTSGEPEPVADTAEAAESGQLDGDTSGDDGRRRRRRGRRGRGRGPDADAPHAGSGAAETVSDSASDDDGSETGEPRGARGTGGTDDTDSADGGDGALGAEEASGESAEGSASSRRRRRRRRGSATAGSDGVGREDDPDDTVVHVREPRSASADVVGVRGSTRLEAKRQRRKDTRESRRRPQILSEAEFLARRESVERVMAIRQRGDLAQVALLEDGVLVEHFVSRTGSESMIGNVYLGKVQNVLPSMEAAFVDIGRGRNAVLYAGEVNWDMAGLVGKARRIETALSSGDTVLVQVSKDPIGHKGARLTSQVSLPGRFLVYVPGGGATGISRKLPDTERRRLKAILDRIVPEGAGVIIRTAAEGVDEAELIRDVERLRQQWEHIEAAAEKKSSAPTQLYAEPGTLIKVIRDLFNSDITSLVVDGDDAWSAVSDYVLAVAPELAERVGRYAGDGDVFGHYRVDEQISKALERKVHLPSGGSLVIDPTEAMTVIDVNTGKFTGSGGNLEETVTRNNLEAAEEIVRQLRLRDIGGIIVVDFIDMVLESNRELVLRRLTECLGRDRTRHQVAEVTSLGLVQMTRKRMGIGLVEAFSEPCPHCGGRGILLHDAPVAGSSGASGATPDGEAGERRNRRRGRPAHDEPIKIEPLVVERVVPDVKPDPRGPRAPAAFRAEAHGESPDTAAEPTPAEPGPAEPDSAAEPPAGVAGRSGADATPPAPADGSSAAVASLPLAPAAGGPALAAKPQRRRRAAGRPAGAPAAVTEALDLVIPMTSAPAAPAGTAATETAPTEAGAAEADGPAGDAGRQPRRRSSSRAAGTTRTRRPRRGSGDGPAGAEAALPLEPLPGGAAG